MASSLKLPYCPEINVANDSAVRPVSSLAKSRLFADCRISSFGAHTSLDLGGRIELVERLVAHLTVTLDLLNVLALAHWQLRNVSYSTIQQEFADMTTETANYGEFVITCIRDCGSKIEHSIFQFTELMTAGSPEDFGECLTTVRDRTDQIAELANGVHGTLDRACEQGDYATSSLIAELLSRTDHLVRMIESNVPRYTNFQTG